MRKFNYEEIIQDFKNGLKTKDIVTKHKCSLQTVHNILNKEGIIVSREDVKRKHFFKDRIFKDLDSEEKAYWLGFIYADGCIPEMKNGRKYFSLGLAVKDLDHLEKFRYFLNYPDTLKLKKNGCYYLIINNMKFVTDLMNLGVKPRKSLTAIFPFISKELVPHFIRGYFDGDGTVYRRKKHLRVSICVAKSFVKGMIENFPKFKITIEEKIDRTRIDKIDDIKEFYSFIYSNCSVCLERKRLVFEKYYLERGSEIIISNPNKD